MARPKAKAPARRYHMSGQSVVTIAGRDYYLGPHDSPESIARYAVLIGIYQQNGLSVPEGLEVADLEPQVATMLAALGSPAAQQADQTNAPILVRHLTAAYREHAKKKYASDNTTYRRVVAVCDELDRHEGDTQAERFGPLKLQEQRDRWVARSISRPYVNLLVREVRRIWKHAVSQELVGESAWNRLGSVEALREGQTEAPEPDPVMPVPLDVVRATAKHLPPVVRDMIRVQVATGMRPSEVCRMRPMDIDRTGETWIYRPAEHKTRKKGKTRAVPIVGDAREAVVGYLNRKPDSHLFSPAEAMAWRRAQRTAARTTPKSCGNRPGTNRKAAPKKQPGTYYTTDSYRRAIQTATKAAGVEAWAPYRLRHTAGTLVRDALGVEAVQALLGHSSPKMAEHYAKLSEAKAIEAAKVAPTL